MCKLSLREDQMASAAYVDQAVEMARSLVNREVRGPGDTENAMHRVERKYGVPYSTLWALRYRKPKDILIGAFLKVAAAYEAQCQEQLKRLEHERAITQATTRLASHLVGAADAVAREKS